MDDMEEQLAQTVVEMITEGMTLFSIKHYRFKSLKTSQCLNYICCNNGPRAS